MKQIIRFKNHFWEFDFNKCFDISSAKIFEHTDVLESPTIFFEPRIDKIEDLTIYEDDLKFEWEGKWGLIDIYFNILIPPIYQSIELFNINLYLVSIWDEEINCDLDDDIDYDIYNVYLNYLFGIVDINNNIIIPIQYTYIRPELSENNLIVIEEGNWTLSKIYQDEIQLNIPNGKYKTIDFSKWLK